MRFHRRFSQCPMIATMTIVAVSGLSMSTVSHLDVLSMSESVLTTGIVAVSQTAPPSSHCPG